LVNEIIKKAIVTKEALPAKALDGVLRPSCGCDSKKMSVEVFFVHLITPTQLQLRRLKKYNQNA